MGGGASLLPPPSNYFDVHASLQRSLAASSTITDYVVSPRYTNCFATYFNAGYPVARFTFVQPEQSCTCGIADALMKFVVRTYFKLWTPCTYDPALGLSTSVPRQKEESSSPNDRNIAVTCDTVKNGNCSWTDQKPF